MKNSLNRNVPNGFIPFVSSHEYQNHLGEYKKVSKKEISSEIKSLSSISELFDYFNVKDGEFIFRSGPIFANIVIGDEINRAAPRTQSATLLKMSQIHFIYTLVLIAVSIMKTSCLSIL